MSEIIRNRVQRIKEEKVMDHGGSMDELSRKVSLRCSDSAIVLFFMLLAICRPFILHHKV